MTTQQPLATQYDRIKSKHKNEILFFRLGDFYEMFYEDAIVASSILNITLTHRKDAPMCGVPHHAAKSYIARLLKAGHKVAICEQLTSPTKGKGIIERGVTEIITPGSVVDDDYLDSNANNFIAAIGIVNKMLCFSWADASTGNFYAFSVPLDNISRLELELFRIAPKELLVMESVLDNMQISDIVKNSGAFVNRYPDWSFSIEKGRSLLLEQFGTKSLRGFGFDDNEPSVACAGLLLDYLHESSGSKLSQIRSISTIDDGKYVLVDEASRKNMEITKNLRDGTSSYSLLSVVNYTKTAMGERELRHRLEEPLRDTAVINKRLSEVDSLYKNQKSLEKIRTTLSACRDLERLSSRLSMEKATPRDLCAIKVTLESILSLADLVPKSSPITVCSKLSGRKNILKTIELISKAIVDEPGINPGEGDVIREKWNLEFDKLRMLKADAHGVLEAYLSEEKEKTGLSNLKIKYNRVSGYFLELSKGLASQAPSHFIRRQTLVNGERYTTEKLSSLELEIESAVEKIEALEKQLFKDLTKSLTEYLNDLFDAAKDAAMLDCAASFAWAATVHGYVKPIVDNSLVLDIKAGRHPVVEAFLPSGSFIANDLCLDGQKDSFALITGPNMAGKSTFLRQNALIVLLSQAGSFVPASSAHIGIVDRIFCRVGAQDNLARGESTFLSEMHETAGILNNATEHSLVIMDEVGRGTSTLDGLSIAWAVCEYVMDKNKSRTLFATHYHELTSMKHKSLVDLSMLVEEREGDVVFMKRVVMGAATGSYGIHVAKLAGIPPKAVERASEIKQILEKDHIGFSDNKNSINQIAASAKPSCEKELLWTNDELVINEIKSTNIDNITPLEALTRLAKLKKMLS